jgi:hypothetical protein
MIRGVDPATRRDVKARAKAEGMSLGRWVLRAIKSALDATADTPSTVDGLHKRLRILEARLDVLEQSHRTLHHHVLATDNRLTPQTQKNRNRWTRAKKSSSS